jgi:acyl-coenzyme A thioesterase PaaI-like protein
VIGVCTLLKLGKTLVVGEVALYSEGDDVPVAHVVGTYALPPARS